MEEEKNVIEIKPLKKTRRILVFLGDFFIAFILSFLLFNVAVYPIGQQVIHRNDLLNESTTYERQRDEILIGNQILFKNELDTKRSFTNYLSYTFDCFLSYYVLNEEMGTNNSDFGHRIDNEVIYHYFVDIKKSEGYYKDIFKRYNSSNNYFDITDQSISLKDEIKIQLEAYFDPYDELSSYGLELYNNCCERLFLPLYGEVIRDIQTNDLVYKDFSYNELSKKIDSVDAILNGLLSVCSVISFFISWLVLFGILPLFDKTHRTLTMIILKIQRIGVNSMSIISKLEVCLSSIYHLAFNLSFIMFLPSLFVNISYIFNLPFLSGISLVSLLISLVSMVFILANQYNRSISDLLSQTVMITEADLDQIYVAKGYKI